MIYDECSVLPKHAALLLSYLLGLLLAPLLLLVHRHGVVDAVVPLLYEVQSSPLFFKHRRFASTVVHGNVVAQVLLHVPFVLGLDLLSLLLFLYLGRHLLHTEPRHVLPSLDGSGLLA